MLYRSLALTFLIVVMGMIQSGCKLILGSQENLSGLDLSRKHPNDKREFRALKLDNGLEVMLISDPDLNKSAAAMDVGIGSLADPEEHMGLAHFLEHMLFLGTSKYPVADEYSQYLSTYQGHSNAYTAPERTNYYFEVNHDGFAGSLDRFAQFFIAPLFNAEFVERELNAVHSEHQKNLKNDGWRMQMIYRSFYKDDHPQRKFSTGTKETLKNASREILIDFYKKHYSANIMKLAMMSNLDLDAMESMAKEKFAAVPNSNKATPQYPADVFDDAKLPRMIFYEPVKDIKKLSLAFETPSREAYWQSKPASMLSHLVGHEGKGSLLSLLKEEQLATGLSAGVDGATYAGVFHTDITLTDKGFADPERVIEVFFEYITMLKDSGLEKYLYDERKTMADINYIYREPKEGGYVASHYASRMHIHPALDVDKNDMLVHKYSVEDYQKFLAGIRPEKLSAILAGPGLPVDQEEEFYGSKFGQKPFSEQAVARFAKKAKNPQLSLPLPNEFIPVHLSLDSAQSSTEPKKIIDNEWGTFWFQQDDTFHLPKAEARLVLHSDLVNKSPKHKALSYLYQSALSDSHNEWNYDISLAGLHYSVSRTDQGIQLDFSGYSEKMTELMQAVLPKLQEITINAETFETHKRDFKRNIANSMLDASYTQGLYHLRYTLTKDMIHRYDIYDPESGVDVVSALTLDDVKKFAQEVYKEIAIEGLVYGSINEEVVKEAVELYPQTLNSSVLPKERRYESHVVRLPQGQDRVSVISTKTNNNSFVMSLQFGERSFELNAAMRIGMAHLKNRFFTELRTKQQLGYIVHAGFDPQEKSLGALVVIQSAEYSAKEVASRVDAWFKTVADELANITPEEFDSYRQSVVTELMEKDKTMGDRHGFLFSEIYLYDEVFDYKAKIAQAAKEISHAQVQKIFAQGINPETRAGMRVHAIKAGAESEKPEIGVAVDDISAFKRESKFFH